jgi:hypothetical protein
LGGGGGGGGTAPAKINAYADDDGTARLYLRDVDPTASGDTFAVDCVDGGGSENIVMLGVTVVDSAPSVTAAPYAKAGKPTLPVFAGDPSSASPSDLRAAGYPPRPNAGTPEYADWLEVVESGATFIAPRSSTGTQGQTPLRHVAPAPAPAGGTDSVEASDNWSGYTISSNADASPYVGVYGAWSVPQAYGGDGTAAWAHSTMWVGIDGAPPTDDVVQTGSEHDTLSAGWLEVSSYAVWTEWYPLLCQVVVNFPVAPGDDLHAWTQVTDDDGAPSATPSVAWFYLFDATQNLYTRVSTAIPGGVTFNGHTAEWILERPDVDGSLTGLAEYASPASLFNASATDLTGGRHDYTSDSSRRISMIDDGTGKTLLSSVAAVSATEMQFTWHAPR